MPFARETAVQLGRAELRRILAVSTPLFEEEALRIPKMADLLPTAPESHARAHMSYFAGSSAPAWAASLLRRKSEAISAVNAEAGRLNFRFSSAFLSKALHHAIKADKSGWQTEPDADADIDALFEPLAYARMRLAIFLRRFPCEIEPQHFDARACDLLFAFFVAIDCRDARLLRHMQIALLPRVEALYTGLCLRDADGIRMRYGLLHAACLAYRRAL